MASATIQEVMQRAPIALQPDATAVEAARVMKDHDIGDVLVCDGDRLRGIVTDRDLVVRCLAEDERPRERQIGELCSQDLITLRPDDAVDRAVELMKTRAVRRIPVVDSRDRVVGIVSIGDLAQERDPHSALGEISSAPPNR